MNNSYDGANDGSHNLYLAMLMVAIKLGGGGSINGDQFESLVNPTDRRMIARAKKAITARDITVIAIWSEPGTKACQNLVVLWRHPVGFELVPVSIARLSDEVSFVLISGDRRTMFKLNAEGNVAASSCSPSPMIEEAIARGTSAFEEGLCGYRDAA